MIRLRPDNPNTAADWDARWSGKGAPVREARHGDKPHEIATRLLPGDVVMDFGAGDGALATLVKSVRPNVAFEAVEPSQFGEKYLREHRAEVYRKVHRVSLPNTKLPDKSADASVIAEVIEHLDDPAAAIAECARIARRVMLITTPYLNHGEDPMHVWKFGLDDVYAMCEPHGRTELAVINGRLTIFTAVWIGRV